MVDSEIHGREVKRPDQKKGPVRVEVVCTFKPRRFPRAFVSPGNCEAVNLLENQLSRRGIVNQPGKLIFEFEVQEETSGQIGIDSSEASPS